jgi:hypothetical protein
MLINLSAPTRPADFTSDELEPVFPVAVLHRTVIDATARESSAEVRDALYAALDYLSVRDPNLEAYRRGYRDFWHRVNSDDSSPSYLAGWHVAAEEDQAEYLAWLQERDFQWHAFHGAG